jgi:hypothetical protein
MVVGGLTLIPGIVQHEMTTSSDANDRYHFLMEMCLLGIITINKWALCGKMVGTLEGVDEITTPSIYPILFLPAGESDVKNG